MTAGFCRAIGGGRGRGGTGHGGRRVGAVTPAGRGLNANHAGSGGVARMQIRARPLPPPARQSCPRRFKRRRACAESRNPDLVCYTTALRSPRPVPPGAPLPAAPPAPPGRPRLRHERGPAAQRFPGERPMPARGARSRGTPAALLASPRAGPGLAASPPPVAPEGGLCPAAAPMCLGKPCQPSRPPAVGWGTVGAGTRV